MVDLSQTVFMQSNNEVFKQTNTHTLTNATSENAMRCISLKIRLKANTPDISWRHPLKSWRLASSVRPVSAAAVPIGLKALVLYALAHVFLSNFWLRNEGCQHPFVQKWALLGPAVCSQYIIVHFLKDGWTNERLNIRPASKHDSYAVRMV